MGGLAAGGPVLVDPLPPGAIGGQPQIEQRAQAGSLGDAVAVAVHEPPGVAGTIVGHALGAVGLAGRHLHLQVGRVEGGPHGVGGVVANVLVAAVHVEVAGEEAVRHGGAGIGVQFLVEPRFSPSERRPEGAVERDAPVASMGSQRRAIDAQAVACQELQLLVLGLTGRVVLGVGDVGGHALEHVLARGRGGLHRGLGLLGRGHLLPGAVIARLSIRVGAQLVVVARLPPVLLQAHLHAADALFAHTLEAVVVRVVPDVVAQIALGAVNPAQGKLVLHLVALVGVARHLQEHDAVLVHRHLRGEGFGARDAALQTQVVIPHARLPTAGGGAPGNGGIGDGAVVPSVHAGLQQALTGVLSHDDVALAGHERPFEVAVGARHRRGGVAIGVGRRHHAVLQRAVLRVQAPAVTILHLAGVGIDHLLVLEQGHLHVGQAQLLVGLARVHGVRRVGQIQIDPRRVKHAVDVGGILLHVGNLRVAGVLLHVIAEHHAGVGHRARDAHVEARGRGIVGGVHGVPLALLELLGVVGHRLHRKGFGGCHQLAVAAVHRHLHIGLAIAVGIRADALGSQRVGLVRVGEGEAQAVVARLQTGEDVVTVVIVIVAFGGEGIGSAGHGGSVALRFVQHGKTRHRVAFHPALLVVRLVVAHPHRHHAIAVDRVAILIQELHKHAVHARVLRLAIEVDIGVDVGNRAGRVGVVAVAVVQLHRVELVTRGLGFLVDHREALLSCRQITAVGSLVIGRLALHAGQGIHRLAEGVQRHVVAVDRVALAIQRHYAPVAVDAHELALGVVLVGVPVRIDPHVVADVALLVGRVDEGACQVGLDEGAVRIADAVAGDALGKRVPLGHLGQARSRVRVVGILVQVHVELGLAGNVAVVLGQIQRRAHVHRHAYPAERRQVQLRVKQFGPDELNALQKLRFLLGVVLDVGAQVVDVDHADGLHLLVAGALLVHPCLNELIGGVLPKRMGRMSDAHHGGMILVVQASLKRHHSVVVHLVGKRTLGQARDATAVAADGERAHPGAGAHIVQGNEASLGVGQILRIEAHELDGIEVGHPARPSAVAVLLANVHRVVLVRQHVQEVRPNVARGRLLAGAGIHRAHGVGVAGTLGHSRRTVAVLGLQRVQNSAGGVLLGDVLVALEAHGGQLVSNLLLVGLTVQINVAVVADERDAVSRVLGRRNVAVEVALLVAEARGGEELLRNGGIGVGADGHQHLDDNALTHAETTAGGI